jgi:UDP-glucose 4-epimerase
MKEASHEVFSGSEVAVVGASGFLGSSVARRLAGSGATVHAYTRTRPIVVDGVLDAEAARASTIYWAATRINPYLAASDKELVEADRRTFATFIDSARATNPDARVVLFSSGGTVYGDAGAPFKEVDPTRPLNEYGAAKAALEEVLLESLDHGTVVRVANAYGPGQSKAPGQGVIGHWLRALLAGEPVQVYGDLSTARDYVFVDDVTEALVRLHGLPVRSSVYNIGSGRPTSLQVVLDTINEVTNAARLKVELLPRRDFDIRASWLDIGRATAELGWRPTTSLRDGIASMWEWLRRGEPAG